MQIRYYLAASAAALSLASVVSAPAFAQQITSGIEGTVTDDAGSPLVGAQVVITDTRTGAARTITTGAAGTFSATGLVTGGPYTISANAGGFEGQTVEDITTTLQGNTSLSFVLSSGQGEIVVTGARVNAKLEAVGPGTSFTAEVLANAPSFNRDIRDIIRIDPRVSLDRDDTGNGVDRISCLGGNDRGNAFTVDGISQSDVYGLNDTGFSSRSSTPIPYDAVRETQVQFAPFDVDYGQFTGCAINVVTKSGTNEYHGGGFFEYSNNNLRGKTINGTTPVSKIQPEKHWGASLGGPIFKDRVFLFGAYEHQEAGLSQDDGPAGAGYANPIAGVPVADFNLISKAIKDIYGVDTGPLVTSRPYTNDRYFARADFQINDQHRFEATYQRLEESTLRTDDFFTGSSPQVTGLNTFYVSGTKSDYYSGRLYSQWTDAFSTELRYSKSKVIDKQDPFGGGEAQSANPIPRIIVGIDNPVGTVDGTVLAGPGTSRSANDLQTRINSYRAVAKLDAGNHKLKFGGEMSTVDLYNVFVQNATGTLVFRNYNDLLQGLLSPGLGNNQTSTTPVNVVGGQTEGAFGNFTASGSVNDAAAQFKRTSYSIFAQDDWRISDQLSAVGGVRIDWYDGGHPQLNQNFVTRYGITNNTGFSNLAPLILPRVAFTYDMDDFAIFSRSQLRVGAGIFSGGDPLVWFGNAFQNDGQGFATANTQAAGCPVGQIDVTPAGTFTGVPACIRTAAAASAALGTGLTQSIDPDIVMPSVLRANIGFSTGLNFAETGFFSGWNLNLDYIYSKTRNPFTIVDLAQTPDIRKGILGYAIDGRPIYSAIDTLQAGCTAKLAQAGAPPVFTNVNAACFTNTANRFDELQLTNAGSYRSHNASLILSKNFDGGLITKGGSVFFNLGYAYTDSQDRRNMYNSTAGSNYDQTAAFDRQNPEASPSFFGSRHNFTLSTNFTERFFGDYATRFGFTFVARSGRPYSLTFTGGAVFNNTNSGSDNALVYIPTGASDPNVAPTSTAGVAQAVADFAKGLDCAKDYLGKTIKRNTCSGDTYYDLDLSFSQELPGPGRLFGVQDKIKLYASFDNFLNLLDNKWNIQRRRDFAGRQDIASVSGVDAQGRYIFTNATGISTFDSDNFINVSSSVWRLKVGVSYDF